MKKDAAHARFVFGQDMIACPRCESFNIGYSTPMKLGGPLPNNVPEMLSNWAKAKRAAGGTPLEGTARIMCRDCGHCGPSVDVSGRTGEDVGRDKAVADEVKRLWNSQAAEKVSNQAA